MVTNAAQDYTPWIIGGAAFLLLAKYVKDQIPNPVPAIKKGTMATIGVGDELTGGLQGDPTSGDYWFELDVPFVEQNVPLIPGLRKDEDESWPQYIFGFDVPGRDPINPASSIYDAAKGLYRRVF
jgi:hypothetical protein